MQKILLVLLTLVSTSLFAQDDLLKQLQSQTPPKREPVIATFKGFKIINIETNETTPKGNLDFRIGHLFGNIGGASGGGLHNNFFGLDNSEDIRIGFHYGITRKLTVGVAHIKRDETMEGIAKMKLLEQKNNGGCPLSLALFGEATYTMRAAKGNEKEQLDTLSNLLYPHRFSYCAQLIIARKFGSKFSMLLAPTYIHYNVVNVGDLGLDNDVYSLGVGLRLKITRSSAIVTDYFFNYCEARSAHMMDWYNWTAYRDAFGIGWEIETGGHVFTIMYTNADGLAESYFIPKTKSTWNRGGFKLSFNISRMFKLTN